MKQEQDLGNIYGFNWLHFNAEYKGYDYDYQDEGYNQVKQVVKTLKNYLT
jgi:thymidylate synthase